MSDMHERDMLATDEMIRNLKAGTFRKVATGIGVSRCHAVGRRVPADLDLRQGNDPEAFKEALRHMPPLNVTVTLDPDSKVTLAEVAWSGWSNHRCCRGGIGKGERSGHSNKGTVFKTVKYQGGEIVTGWKFPNGAARSRSTSTATSTSNPRWGRRGLTRHRRQRQTRCYTGRRDRPEGTFSYCKWFNGELG